MEPTTKYLTLYPSKSTTRSILAEPMEQRSGPVGQVQVLMEQAQVQLEQGQEPQERALEESTTNYPTLYPSPPTNISMLAEPIEQVSRPLEMIQEPLEQSQEQLKQDLVQEERKLLEEKIEQIVNLKTKNTPWQEIGEAVKLSQETCCQIWEQYSRQLEKAKAAPQPETSRRFKSWSKSEDEILLRLQKVGRQFNEMGPELEGRSEGACRRRYERLCVDAHNPLIGKRTAENEARKE